MKESEIRMLFIKISNFYNTFAYDDLKVQEWQEILEGVTYNRAVANLKKHTLNPSNEFPPHPGKLAVMPAQQNSGPAIPNAEETRQMLKDRDEAYSLKAIIMPDFVKEAAKQIGQSTSPAGHKTTS